MSNDHGATDSAYCPHCDETNEIISTVPWQEDICEACNNAVPSSET